MPAHARLAVGPTNADPVVLPLGTFTAPLTGYRVAFYRLAPQLRINEPPPGTWCVCSGCAHPQPGRRLCRSTCFPAPPPAAGSGRWLTWTRRGWMPK